MRAPISFRIKQRCGRWWSTPGNNNTRRERDESAESEPASSVGFHLVHRIDVALPPVRELDRSGRRRADVRTAETTHHLGQGMKSRLLAIGLMAIAAFAVVDLTRAAADQLAALLTDNAADAAARADAVTQSEADAAEAARLDVRQPPSVAILQANADG